MLRFVIHESTYLKIKSNFLKKFFVCNINLSPHSEECLSTFTTSNATSKQTVRNRFYDLEEKTLSLFTQYNIQNIHDTAVSSGVTSVELYEKITQIKPVDFFVSDKYAVIYSDGNKILRFYDQEKKFICCYCCKIYFSPFMSWKFFISKAFSFLFKKIYATISENPRLLYLLNRDLSSLIQQGKINFIEYDILNTHEFFSFDFVRCMNLLNYFEEKEMHKALKNIYASLSQNGIFLSGRTIDNRYNKATFYIKEPYGFRVLFDINGGDENKKFVLQDGINTQ